MAQIGDRRLLPGPGFQSQFPLFAVGDVADDADEQGFFPQSHLADGKFQVEHRAVLAQAGNLPREPQDPRVAREEITLDVSVVQGPVRFGHQKLDVLTHDFLVPVAENSLRRGVERFHDAVFENRHDAVHGIGENRTAPAFADLDFLLRPVPFLFHPKFARVEHQRQDGDGAQEQEQDQENLVHRGKRGEGFPGIDFGHHAHVQFGQPVPGAHHGHAPVIRIPVHIESRFSANRVLHRQGQGSVFLGGTWLQLRRRHAKFEIQNGSGGFRLLGEKPFGFEILIEPAVGQERAGLIEGVGFPGSAEPAHLQHPAELGFRADAERQHSGDQSFFIPDGRGREHGRPILVPGSVNVGQVHLVLERGRHHRIALKGPVEKIGPFGEGPLAHGLLQQSAHLEPGRIH